MKRRYKKLKSSFKKKFKRNSNEVKFVTGTIASYNPAIYEYAVGNQTLQTAGYVKVGTFPAQGTNQNQRIGNCINKCKLSIKITLDFFRQLAIGGVDTPISFVACRVIVFCSPEKVFTGDITDFFGTIKSTHILQQIYTNKSAITVIYDKYHKWFNNQVNIFPESALKNPINATLGSRRMISIKRNLGQVLFPFGSSTSPKKTVQNTYVAILQDNYCLGSTAGSKLIWSHIQTRTYFTD